jgi:hypothetical protein
VGVPMAIQTVTNANLAEYVASRPQPSQLTSPQAVTDAVNTPKEDAPTPGNPVIKAGEEKLEGTPDPGPQLDPKDKPKKKSSIQDRIDELVKEKHELDEAFQSEYEQRLLLQGEVNALKSQAPKVEEPKKDEIGAEPDPATYTDQKVFLKEWGEWQRKTARAEFAAEQAKARAAEEAARREAAMQAKVAQARKDYPDFVQVAQAADRRTREVPGHIQAAFHDSDWGAHLAYHLMKDEAEEKRIFSLSPAKALLELGKIEDTFAKRAKAEGQPEPAPVAVTPEPKPVPSPIARLGESAGIAPTDLSKPMEYKDYRRARLEQIRTSGRRR